MRKQLRRSASFPTNLYIYRAVLAAAAAGEGRDILERKPSHPVLCLVGDSAFRSFIALAIRQIGLCTRLIVVVASFARASYTHRTARRGKVRAQFSNCLSYFCILYCIYARFYCAIYTIYTCCCTLYFMMGIMRLSGV